MQHSTVNLVKPIDVKPSTIKNMPAPTGPPRRRLDSLSKPRLGPRQNAPAGKPKPAAKANCCDDPKIEEEDGIKACVNCGTQISESNIVADVTFQEDSRGAATVQGGFISDNARHARTLGSGAYRKIGGGERNTMQEIENNGRREIGSLCTPLSIPESVQLQALSIFSMAARINFNAGRRTGEVVAACLFAVLRRSKDNTVLLMDIAEVQKINVFRLGEVYKDLLKSLFLGGEYAGVQHLVEVEPLIMKYCRKLEFGEATRQVAEDAIKIIRRMKRDWIVTGRHPAGLCGACIILAARMNNFRRSVREVVYVAKVADATVAKRVEEFRRTKSSALTVDQFREFGVRMKHQHDPPVLGESELKAGKWEEKKRKRQEHNKEREAGKVIDIDDGTDASSRASSVTSDAPASTPTDEDGHKSKRQRISPPQPTLPPTQQEPRFDADGFAIPALPARLAIDPAITAEESTPPKHRRGRTRKSEKPPPIQISPEELATELELEAQMEEALNDDEIADSRNEIERAKADERVRLLADQQRQLAAEQTQERRNAQGVTWWNDKEATSEAEITAEQLEAEFADDPEVLNCRLSDTESKIKEQIWLAHNEDWLRSQHEKELNKRMAEADGRDKSKKGAKGGRKKKKAKPGDGTLLAEAGTPIETPADASAAMIAKRAPAAFSKHIDYEKLASLYGNGDSPSTSRSPSRAPSQAPSETNTAPTTISNSPVPLTPGRRVTNGLQSPAATQQADTNTTTTAEAARPPGPASPPETQQQAEAGAERERGEEEENDDGDYHDDVRSDSGSPAAPSGWDEEVSDREDIGEEDDFDQATDIMGGVSFDRTYGADDEFS